MALYKDFPKDKFQILGVDVKTHNGVKFSREFKAVIADKI